MKRECTNVAEQRKASALRDCRLRLLPLLIFMTFGSASANSLFGDDQNGQITLTSPNEGEYSIVAGWNENPNAQSGLVNIDNAIIKALTSSDFDEGFVYGARYLAPPSPSPETIQLIKNRVEMSNSSASTIYGAFANGANNSTSAVGNENSVSLKGQITSVNNSQAIYGAYISQVVDGSATNNQVILESADLSINNRLMIDGASTWVKNSTVTNNKVSITNSQISVDWGHISGASPDGSNEEVAIGNIVEVVSSKLNATDTANFVVAGARLYTNGTEVERVAQNNSVWLHNSEVSGQVFGAIDSQTGVGIDSSNFIVVSGVNSAKSIDGFEILKVQIGEENQTLPVLTLSDEVDFSSRKIEISDADGFNWDGKGDYLLLNAKQIEGVTEENITLSDLWIDYKASVFVDQAEGQTENLILSTVSAASNENSKTLAQAYLGSLAFIAQGAEFIADQGLDVASVAVANSNSPASFGAAYGGSSRYETGSHVDVDGVGFVVGIATKYGNTTYAGFMEAGWGSSESVVSSARGDGDHNYYGLGLGLRHLATDKVYIDTSLRAGWSETDFSGNYGGASAGYDSSAFYMTGHLGAGVVMPVTERLSADFYGRYILTYIDSDDVSLRDGSGSHLSFDSSTAHAVRLGTRLNSAWTENVTWRAGVAYEHVFDGDANAEVNGISLLVPTIEGDTGVFELGVTFKPSATSGWSCDLGVNGYVGDRQGVAGNLTARYSF